MQDVLYMPGLHNTSLHHTVVVIIVLVHPCWSSPTTEVAITVMGFLAVVTNAHACS